MAAIFAGAAALLLHRQNQHSAETSLPSAEAVAMPGSNGLSVALTIANRLSNEALVIDALSVDGVFVETRYRQGEDILRPADPYQVSQPSPWKVNWRLAPAEATTHHFGLEERSDSIRLTLSSSARTLRSKELTVRIVPIDVTDKQMRAMK